MMRVRMWPICSRTSLWKPTWLLLRDGVLVAHDPDEFQ